MTAFSASAPGKVILFGEHAVVYGQPAIAVPVTQVQAKVMIMANPTGASSIEAPNIGLNSPLDALPADHPLLLAIHSTLSSLARTAIPPFRMKITSSIPVSSGLGSGAAVSVAIARAVSAFLGCSISNEAVNAIAFRVDQAHHGTPSGIDNTVITYAQPVWYIRGQPFERLAPGAPFTLVIANTGISASTGAVVADVRRRRQDQPGHCEALFQQIGQLARSARSLIENGVPEQMGPLMSSNHDLLRELDVSSPELDRLVSAALAGGALGAKLCGSGRGGNMIALAGPAQAAAVAQALTAAGATHTIITQVEPWKTSSS